MNKITKSSILALVLGVSSQMVGANASLAQGTDVVTAIDESGSMAGEQAWIPNMIADLEAALLGNTPSVGPNQYGITGFGSITNDPPGPPIEGPYKKLFTAAAPTNEWGTANDVQTLNFAPPFDLSGGTEDGWAAIDFILNQYTFRPTAVKNIILVTDEDRDNTVPLTKQDVLDSLTNNNALLNAVVDNPFIGTGVNAGDAALGIDSNATCYFPDGLGGFITGTCNIGNGAGNTEDDYVDLALQTGGAAWDLNQLRAGGNTATSFTAAFVAIKVEEIEEELKTPEPASLLGLLAIGSLTLASKSKKQS